MCLLQAQEKESTYQSSNTAAAESHSGNLSDLCMCMLCVHEYAHGNIGYYIVSDGLVYTL